MSDSVSFGCACCSPRMLPAYQHDQVAWQSLLADAAAQEGARGAPQAVIFHGGHIHPDPEHPGRKVEAIGIADGKVIVSGRLHDVRKAMTVFEPLERPLSGEQTLLPGLIDAHAHTLTSALIIDWTDLSPFEGQNLNTHYDIQLIEKRLRAAVKKAQQATPPMPWVMGFGVDPSLMKVWTDIDAKFLDGISTEVKMFLLNASGHISYANTPALQAAKLDKDFPDGVLTEQQSAAMHGGHAEGVPGADARRAEARLPAGEPARHHDGVRGECRAAERAVGGDHAQGAGADAGHDRSHGWRAVRQQQ